VAQNIVASLYRRPLKAFSFKTIGLLASIGRRRGVARIFGFNFSGFFAWWLWRTIYLSKLPGLDKKIRVAFEWTLDLIFRKDVCAVHQSPRRSDCYHEEHREIKLAATATASQQRAPTPAAALTNSYAQKKENVREYPAPVSGQEQWAS
jgi:hypothetical protein